jgi:GNAT superfamily N-acetyltransferase
MVGLPRTSRDDLSINKATDEDVPIIQSMVDAAYTKYIDRIGKRPAPMDENYHQAIHTHTVLVLRETAKDQVVGAIVLDFDPSSDSVKIVNLVVHPAAQGHGYGRVLMNCAEDLARSQDYRALTLYTNVKMYENLGVYPKMGFHELERKHENGFDRVYFRKILY